MVNEGSVVQPGRMRSTRPRPLRINKPSGSPDDPNTLGIQATPSPPPGVTGTNETTYERPIARLVYAPDGELLDADPSGYPDAPDPLPVLPALSGSALARIEGRIVTLQTPTAPSLTEP